MRTNRTVSQRDWVELYCSKPDPRSSRKKSRDDLEITPQSTPIPPGIPLFYTVKQVADILQFDVDTVYQWIKEGRLDATRFGPTGRNLRVSAQSFNTFVTQGVK